MSHATVVRYTTRPGSADENEKLIKAVFAQLADQMPDGLRYVAIRLGDGVSFMHIAILEGDNNPLASLPAFSEFRNHDRYGSTYYTVREPYLDDFALLSPESACWKRSGSCLNVSNVLLEDVGSRMVGVGLGRAPVFTTASG